MIRSFQGITPRIAATAYIDESAQVIGDVVIGEHSSVWPNAVIRGDDYYIRIGNETNVQDNCVFHVESERYAVILGDRVSVGHNVVLHGCHVESRCLIGMGAIILNNAHIGARSIIAAGAVIPENAVIPPGSLCMGVPGRVKRQVNEEEVRRIEHVADAYLRLKQIYLAAQSGQALSSNKHK